MDGLPDPKAQQARRIVGDNVQSTLLTPGILVADLPSDVAILRDNNYARVWQFTCGAQAMYGIHRNCCRPTGHRFAHGFGEQALCRLDGPCAGYSLARSLCCWQR
jgi:hypothetical protein